MTVFKFIFNCLRLEIKHSQWPSQIHADVRRTQISTEQIGLCTVNISQGKECTVYIQERKDKKCDSQIATKSFKIYSNIIVNKFILCESPALFYAIC